MPHDVWRSWGGPPLTLVSVASVACWYALGVRSLWTHGGPGRGIARWRVVSFAAGWMAIALALLSPLDALGETLFSAHMVQHLLLMTVAPPLLVLGLPHLAGVWALPRGSRAALARRARVLHAIGAPWRAATAWPVALAAHTVATWVWHAPRLYQLALADERIHLLEHASFTGTAILIWWRVLVPRGEGRGGYGLGIVLLLATLMQTGALGAVLALAREPWFSVHAAGARAWGLSPLEDQQLAGLIMWVPGGLLYIAAASALFAAWIDDRGAARAQRRMPMRVSEVTP